MQHEVLAKRVYPDLHGHLDLSEQGTYGQDSSGLWWAHVPCPNCPIGVLSDHDIEEHPDGTITVTPSILWPDKWHGYLKRGFWMSV